ncbi:uncharacterized protein LOC123322734 [Coccinella septempunctata]|uniref:uncharacterized protein LOC123322734 n=1 Tax=Coccinella septempunctata TaxID=41139 RepID=UPI001D0704E6|nr:uncharacterized protein LOC123322734 [Coccinella septempunctata]
MEDLNPMVQSCGYNVCQECSFTHIEFIRMISNEELAREFLMKHGALSCHSLCETCGSRVRSDFERNQYRCRKVVFAARRGNRKCETSRSVFQGQWVLGGVERGEQGEKGKAFLVPVEDRSSETLIGIIKRYVKPGTTIMTDCWRGYDALETEGFRHFTVNHSLNFVDPETGAYTQTIERLWVEVRRNVPKAGFRQEHLWGYLSDVLFRRMEPCYGRRRHMFWKAAATLYSPEHPLA